MATSDRARSQHQDFLAARRAAVARGDGKHTQPLAPVEPELDAAAVARSDRQCQPRGGTAGGAEVDLLEARGGAAIQAFQRLVGASRAADLVGVSRLDAGIGILHWKEHRTADAIAALERALAIREAGEPDVSVVAETRFGLARALWDAGRDRSRARRLAAAARANYQGPPLHAAEVRAVDAWLASHDGV
jgi:hypothetical protein